MRPALGYRPRADRSGFTIVELLVVVMIVGILAGLALPNLRGAALRADAAHVVADARTVGLAAYEYLSDHGQFPPSGPTGAVPEEMEEVLDGVPFEYKGLTYTWYGINIPSEFNVSGPRNAGVFAVEFNDQQAIGNALSGFTGPDMYWSEDMFYVVFWD
jgi:prepilin-type N-terminal cleavage/methylation domain-containing protein